jgi:transketolase
MAKRATREALGKTLVELVEAGYDVMAVDADLAGSTKSGDLGKVYPDRLVDVGIAEQNMVGVAAGLALTGRTVFTSSFAVFGTGRCWDQIRNTVCDTNLDVKICPTHAGVTTGEDGATHQALEDIALMRALPRMRVMVPADYNSTRAAIKLAAQTPGPVYIRMGRFAVEDIYGEDFEAALPKAQVLREGSDLSIMACGVEVSQALEAAELLAAEGINAEVIDVFSIKPLDEATILASAAKTGLVLAVEEHSVYGGMGSAIAELLSEKQPCKMGFVGMHGFGTTAPGGVLLKHFGLDAAGIVAQAKELVASR